MAKPITIKNFHGQNTHKRPVRKLHQPTYRRSIHS